MKKINKLVIAICIVFLFSYCSKKIEQIKVSLTTIDLENVIDSNTEGKSLNEFIDTLLYIPLETREVTLVDDVQKVLFYKGEIFLSDYNHLFKFAADGKYICKIGTMGRGPRDYSMVSNFFIRSDTIFVRSGNKILAFNTTDGNFLSSIQFDSKYRRVYVNKTENHFVFFNYQNNKIEFYNGNGQLIDSVRYSSDKREILDLAIIFSYYEILFGTNISLKISSFCNDTIFEIGDNFKLTPKYVVNLGKYKIPEKFRPDVATWDFFLNNSSGYLRKILIETKDFLIIQLGRWDNKDNTSVPLYPDKKSGIIGLAFFDKSSNNISLIKNDEENLPCFYPNFTDGENHLLSFVNSIDAINFYEQNKSKFQFNKSFLETINQIKIEDNPVVIIAKLKE